MANIQRHIYTNTVFRRSCKKLALITMHAISKETSFYMLVFLRVINADKMPYILIVATLAVAYQYDRQNLRHMKAMTYAATAMELIEFGISSKFIKIELIIAVTASALHEYSFRIKKEKYLVDMYRRLYLRPF
jgi:hypothetical protein